MDGPNSFEQPTELDDIRDQEEMILFAMGQALETDRDREMEVRAASQSSSPRPYYADTLRERLQESEAENRKLRERIREHNRREVAERPKEAHLLSPDISYVRPISDYLKTPASRREAALGPRAIHPSLGPRAIHPSLGPRAIHPSLTPPRPSDGA